MTMTSVSSYSTLIISLAVATYAISSVNGFVAYPSTSTTSAAASRCKHNSLSSPPLQHVTNLFLSPDNNNDLNNNDATTISDGNNNKEQEENLTSIGSTEYYKGFLTRSAKEEPIERVTGDAILGPTLKFAGGVSLILVVLVLAFLGSNGLL